MKNLLQEFNEYLSVLLLASFGGAVRYFSVKPKNEKVSHGTILIEIITAAFAGLVVSFLIGPTDINEQWKSAAAALAGYSSKGVLHIVSNLFLKRIKEG